MVQLDEALKLSKKMREEEQTAKTALQTILQQLDTVCELPHWSYTREFELGILTAAKDLLTRVHDGLQ